MAAADAELDAYARLAADLREPYHEGHALAMEAMRALLLGRYELAEPLVARAHALLVRAQEPDADEILVLQRFTLCRDQGRLSDVEKEVHRLNGRSPPAPAWEALEALLECERRRDRAARSIFDRLAADRFGNLPEDLRWGIAMAALADSCAHLDDPDSAEVLSELLASHAGCAVSCVGTVCWGSVERSLGLLAAITGNAERAIAHLRTACERHRKMAARPWLARSRYELAAVLEPRHAEEAGRLREEALALARKLGMGDVGQRWAPLGKRLAQAATRT